jgi:hypothetical protein
MESSTTLVWASLAGVTHKTPVVLADDRGSFLRLPPKAYPFTPDAPSARIMTSLYLASRKTAVPGERLQRPLVGP